MRPLLPTPTRGRLRSARGIQRGMTLIELMIASLLSVGIISAVGYAYVQQRTLHRHHDELSVLQTGARLAFEDMGREIRQAGAIGCNSAMVRHGEKRVTETVVVPPFAPAAVPAGADNFTIDANTALRVFDASAAAAVWGGSRPSGPTGGTPVAGTPVIEVRYGSSDGATRLSGALPVTGLSIPTLGTLEPARGDQTPSSMNRLALLADCQSALVVVVDSVQAGSVTTQNVPVDFARCSHASRVGSTCFHWPATTLMPIRVVQYFVSDLGTPSNPDRRLMVRKRVMSTGGIEWNPPVTVAQGVRDLRVTGLGLDAAAPANVSWQVLRTVDENVEGLAAIASLPAAEWARVIRIDLRLQMQASRAGGSVEDRPIVRNFESSFTIRSRVAQDPT